MSDQGKIKLPNYLCIVFAMSLAQIPPQEGNLESAGVPALDTTPKDIVLHLQVECVLQQF